MPAVIEIVEGSYKIRGRDTSMSGVRFELVEGFRFGSSGGFVTVAGGSAEPANSGIPDRNIKIKCEGVDSYRVVSEVDYTPAGDKSLVQMKVSDSYATNGAWVTLADARANELIAEGMEETL